MKIMSEISLLMTFFIQNIFLHPGMLTSATTVQETTKHTNISYAKAYKKNRNEDKLLPYKMEELKIPVVISSWGYTFINNKAWNALTKGRSPVDAIVRAITSCELDVPKCDFRTGLGAHQDLKNETRLDAMLMDGTTMSIGAVGNLKNIKNAIKVAKFVLQDKSISLITDCQATDFALRKGFHEAEPIEFYGDDYGKIPGNINMIVINKEGQISAGSSSNGFPFSYPGSVGSSAIAGASAYADSKVGAAVATGDNDLLQKFLPSYKAVEDMRRGTSPAQAAYKSMRRIISHKKNFVGGVIAVSKVGVFGAACSGMDIFSFTVTNQVLNKTRVFQVSCEWD